MGGGHKTLAEEKKQIWEATSQAHSSQSGSRNPGRSLAAPDAAFARSGKSTQPGGLVDSIWASPSGPTTSPTTTNSGGTSLFPSPTQTEEPSWPSRPRGSTHSARPTVFVNSVHDNWDQKPSSELRFRKPAVKLISVGTSIPATTSTVTRTPQKKAAAHNTSTLKAYPTGDGFELIEHGELEEDFDVVSGEGPSVSNGTSTPDPDDVMDELEGAFRSLGKGVQGWKDKQ